MSKDVSILSEGKNQKELLIKCLEFIDCYKANSLVVSMKQSVNRVNELLGLLEIRGKFVEAAKIGNEDDQSIQAGLNILCDPDSHDSALARIEINILSLAEISLCEMWRYLSETPKERSLRIHFLVSQRILNVYLHLNKSLSLSSQKQLGMNRQASRRRTEAQKWKKMKFVGFRYKPLAVVLPSPIFHMRELIVLLLLLDLFVPLLLLLKSPEL
ncbi:hypothetical protein L1887_01087 [Cichorium endivia]|nr:hypothetical protein L1887_01087 [Cichorium endivia]